MADYTKSNHPVDDGTPNFIRLALVDFYGLDASQSYSVRGNTIIGIDRNGTGSYTQLVTLNGGVGGPCHVAG